MIRLARAVAPLATTASLVLFSACGGDGGGGGGTDPDPTDAIQSVTVSPATGQVALGGTLQFSATVRNGRNETVNAAVTWTTSDDGVATVDANGLVTGVAPGSVTVTASVGGRSGTAGVESFDPNPPAAPGDVAATPISNTEVDVTWSDNSSSETGHVILREEAGASASPGARGTSAVFVDAGSVGPDVTSFRDSGLTPGTVYRYRVQACNAAGCSDPTAAGSEPATFPTLTIDTPDPLPSGQVGAAYQVDLQSSGPPATWSHVDGVLPAGLSLSDEGRLAGTPTEGGVFTPTVMAQGGGQMVTRALGLTIITPPAVTTTDLPDGIRGTAYAATLEASGGDGTYVWALTAGTLPAGLALAGDGTIAGTPSAAGSSFFTVQVTSAGLQASAQLGIEVLEPLQITTTALSTAVINTAYAQSLGASGGVAPYAWSLVSGSLPAGLGLAADGTISGTPTTLGTSDFRVGVTSSDGQSVEADLSVTVNDQIVAPVVTTGSLPDGGVGAAYAAQLAATDGDGTYAWAVTAGTLPAGLSLDAGTGAIAGTPGAAGTSDVTVQVTSGGLTGTADLSITVHPALTIATTTLPSGVQGTAYGALVGVTGGDGTPTVAVVAGALPAGLGLDAGTGALGGTPSAAGTSNFTVEATNALGQSAQQALSIEIFAPLSVTTASLPDGAAGVPYAETVQATGGDGAYTWSVTAGSLPAGLSLAPGSGTVSGTPTTPGTANFTVQVASGDGQTATADLAIAVTSGGPVITTTSLPGGLVGTAYSQMVQVTGGDGSYAWTVNAGALPTGLGLGPSNGVISGTPSAVGTFDFTVQVTSAGQSDTQHLSIVVTAPPVGFSRSYLPGGYIGVGYTGTPDPATGGAGPLTYSITAGALPAGLSLNASTGQITGTPTTAGMAFFEMTASDGSSSASVVFGVTISTAAPGGFNLFGVNVANSIPAADVQTAINQALAKIEAAITGDAPGFVMPASGLGGYCSGNGGLFHGETVDDVEVLIDIGPIDGPGSIAGQGGICMGFASPAPTVVAQLTLDSADLGPLPASLKLALVLHEMLHGMGFADGLFTALSLSTGSGGATPEYVGAGGVADFQGNLGGAGNPPLEETGGSGTAYSHWDEAFFNTELMTGFLDGSGNAFSSMTIAVLGDLGWPAVNPAAADAYAIPGCSPACTPPAGAPGAAETKIPLLDDVLTGPVGILQPDGTVRTGYLGGR